MALGDELGVYIWKAAYAEKGADARLHIGMTVQRAIALGTEHGIADPLAYAFICHDAWEAEAPQEAEYAEMVTGRNEAGQPVTVTVQTRPATPGREAGDRYGFRYDQLNLFIAAAERAARKAA